MDERKYVWHQCKDLTRALRHVFGYANNNTASIEREEPLHGVVMELRQIDRLPVELVPVIMFVANICDQIARDLSKDKNSSRPSVDIRDLRVCCYHLQVPPLAGLLHGHPSFSSSASYSHPLQQQLHSSSAAEAAVSAAMNMAAAALVPPLPVHHSMTTTGTTGTTNAMNRNSSTSSAIGTTLSDVGAPGLHAHPQAANLNFNLSSQHSYGPSNHTTSGAPSNTNLTIYGDPHHHPRHHQMTQMNMNMNMNPHHHQMTHHPHHHLHHLAAAAHQEQQLFSQQPIHPHHSLHHHHQQAQGQQQSMYYPHQQPLQQHPVSLVNTKSSSINVLQQSNVAPANTSLTSTASPSIKKNVPVAVEKKKVTVVTPQVSISEPSSSSSSSVKSSASVKSLMKSSKASAETTNANEKEEHVTTHRTGLGILQSLRSGTTTTNDTKHDPTKKKHISPLMTTIVTSTEMINDVDPDTEQTKTECLPPNDMSPGTEMQEKNPIHENPDHMPQDTVELELKSRTTRRTNPNPTTNPSKLNKREQSKKQPRTKKASSTKEEDQGLNKSLDDTPNEKHTPASNINFFSGQTLEETAAIQNVQALTTTSTSRKDQHATSALKALLKIQSSSLAMDSIEERRLDMDPRVFSHFSLQVIEQLEQQTQTNIIRSSSSSDCYVLIRGSSLPVILTAQAMLIQQQEDFQQKNILTSLSSSTKGQEPLLSSKKEKDIPMRKTPPAFRSRRSSGNHKTGPVTSETLTSSNSKQKYVRVKKDKTQRNNPVDETRSKMDNQIEHLLPKEKAEAETPINEAEAETPINEAEAETLVISQENNQEEHVEEAMKLQWAQEAALDERSSKVFTHLPYHDAKKIMESYQVKQDTIKNPSAWFQKTCSNFKNRSLYHQSKILNHPLKPKVKANVVAVKTSNNAMNPLVRFEDLPQLEIMSPEMQPQPADEGVDSKHNIWNHGDENMAKDNNEDAPLPSSPSGIGSHIHPPPQVSHHHALGRSSSFSPWTVGKDWSFLSGR